MVMKKVFSLGHDKRLRPATSTVVFVMATAASTRGSLSWFLARDHLRRLAELLQNPSSVQELLWQ